MLRHQTLNDDRHKGMTMSYRLSGQGVWYIEWRVTPYSYRPVAVRRARDTEIELIERIRALEALLRNPSAPRPVAALQLKPFKYVKPPEPTTIPSQAPQPKHGTPPNKLGLGVTADAPAVGRPPHNGRTGRGDRSSR